MTFTILDLFIDPPLTVARLGGSSMPQDAFVWEAARRGAAITYMDRYLVGHDYLFAVPIVDRHRTKLTFMTVKGRVSKRNLPISCPAHIDLDYTKLPFAASGTWP
jgi:hypothetical protein